MVSLFVVQLTICKADSIVDYGVGLRPTMESAFGRLEKRLFVDCRVGLRPLDDYIEVQLYSRPKAYSIVDRVPTLFSAEGLLDSLLTFLHFLAPS